VIFVALGVLAPVTGHETSYALLTHVGRNLFRSASHPSKRSARRTTRILPADQRSSSADTPAIAALRWAQARRSLRPRRNTRPMIAALVLCALVFGAPDARADGAFPDSMRIFVPTDAPHRIVLATNFGLLISEDEGATFFWVCEAAVSTNAFLYQMGPPPTDAIYAVSPTGLYVSTDNACSFTRSGGVLDAQVVVSDAFPDPTDATHVFAIAKPSKALDAPMGVYESHDTGATFAGPTLSQSSTVNVAGIESAASNASVVYVSAFDRTARKAMLFRSSDRGAHYDGPIDISAELGTRLPLIAAVHPTDAGKIYFRILSDRNDAFGYSHDSGQTVHVPLMVDYAMSALLARADDSLLVATSLGKVYTSTDAGQTFVTQTTWPHVRALAERNGMLYIAADDMVDGYALAVSGDQGGSWRPLLHFSQITGMKPCGAVEATCNTPWKALVRQLRIGGSGADASTAASADGSTSSVDGGSRFAVFPPDGASGANPVENSRSGCACGTVEDERTGCSMTSVFIALFLLSRRKRPGGIDATRPLPQRVTGILWAPGRSNASSFTTSTRRSRHRSFRSGSRATRNTGSATRCSPSPPVKG
jgi:hypothetical protein